MDVKKSGFKESLRELLARRFASYGKEDALADIVAFCFAFLFSGAHGLYGAFPFGIALLAVVRRHAVAVLLGVLLGTVRLGSVAPAYLAIYALLFAARMLFSAPIRRRFLPCSEAFFSELPQIRLTLCILFCFGAAAYEIFYGAAAFYVFFFCLAMILLGPVAALCFLPFCECADGFSLLFSPVTEKTRYGRASPLLWQGSVLALSLVTVRALAGFALFGISADIFFAAFFTLFFSKRFGTIKGAAAGAALSLLFGWTALPAFLLLGAVSGLLWRFGGIYAMTLSVAAAGVYCGYVGGLSTFVSLMPELALSALLAWPIYTRIALGYAPKAAVRLPAAAALPKSEPPPRLPSGTGEEDARLLRISSAFGRLSRTFAQVSDKMRDPSLEEYCDACTAAARRHCAGCAEQRSCWSEGGTAQRGVRAFCEGSHRGGALDGGCLPPELTCHCQSVDKLLTVLTQAASGVREKHHRGNRTGYLATDYAMVSRLFEEAAKHQRTRASEDVKCTLALSAALRELGVQTETLAVYGDRNRRIVAGGKNWQGKSLSADTLRKTAESICGTALTDPEFYIDGSSVTMEMKSRTRLGAEVAMASMPSDSGEVSGDQAGAFQNEEEYFYAYISDGMGSGRDAAVTSGLCGEFLREMLESGCGKTTTLKMLNQMVRSKGSECFATVDLLEVDLLTGKACFIKSGAASSYVKRGDHLFRIRAGTSPVGILPSLDAERIDFEVKVGDTVILMSDGVSASPEETPWLLDLLGEPLGDDLAAVADRVLTEARQKNSASDDMSVCLVRITPPKKRQI